MKEKGTTCALLMGLCIMGVGGTDEGCTGVEDGGVLLQVEQPGKSLLPFVADEVWLHDRDGHLLNITVVMTVHCARTFDCHRYSVRLSFRTEDQGDAAGRGGEMLLESCIAEHAQKPRHDGMKRFELIFSVPAPALLVCHEHGSRHQAGWTFARYKEKYAGCLNNLEASLHESNDLSSVIHRSPVVKFTAHEALEAASLQAASSILPGHICRGDLPELLHVVRGGEPDGQRPPSSLKAIELGVARGKYSNALLQSRHIAHLYSVDSWDDDNRGHFIDEYFAVVQAFRAWGHRSTVLRLTFEHAFSFFADGHFDFVYIDGYAHTGQDGGTTLEAWYRKVSPGGMLAGHDYDLSRWPLTYHNVNLFANRNNLTVIVTDACYHDGYASWAILVPDEEEMELLRSSA